MVKHSNYTILQDVQRILNSKTGEQIGFEVEDKLNLNIPVEHIQDFCESTIKTSSGTSTITLSSTSDTYITGFTLDLAKDATSDCNTCTLTATSPYGGKTLGRMEFITGVAESKTLQIMFKQPMKLKRGGTITLSSTFTIGATRNSATIYGYTVETDRKY